MQLRALLGLVLTASVGCVQQQRDPGDDGPDPDATQSLPVVAVDTNATAGVSVTVTGPGRVTSVPPGIDCVAGGGGCRAEFSPELQKVTLVVDHASTVRWAGACAGNGDCPLSPIGSAVSAETFAPQDLAFVESGREGQAESLAVGADGQLVATGWTRHELQAMNVWTRMYDADGAVVWSHERASTEGSSDDGHAIALDGAGNAIVAGRWYSHTDTRMGWLVMALSPTGAPTWSQVGDSIADDDELLGIAANPAGDTVAVGYRPDAGWWVRGLAAGGAELWSRTGDGSAALAVDLGADGTSYVAGRKAMGASGDDAWLVAYTPGGTVRWSAGHDGPDHGNDTAAAVAVGPDGTLAVAGREGSRGWVAVYDSTGALVWDALTDDNGAWAGVAIDVDGSVVATSPGLSKRYDANGGEVWTRSIGGRDVVFDLAGNVVVTNGPEIVRLYQ
jgi:hypothetical protein